MKDDIKLLITVLSIFAILYFLNPLTTQLQAVADVECINNSQCPTSLNCVNNVCILTTDIKNQMYIAQQPECSKNTDCNNRMVCNSYHNCVISELACAPNDYYGKYCPEGYKCNSRQICELQTVTTNGVTHLPGVQVTSGEKDSSMLFIIILIILNVLMWYGVFEIGPDRGFFRKGGIK